MTTNPPHNQPGGVSGKKVLLISLIACLAIPFVMFFLPVWWIESHKPPAEVLVWSQRATWEIVPTKPQVLAWGDTPRPPFEGRDVTELPFTIPADAITHIEVLVASARHWDEEGPPLAGLRKPSSAEGFYDHYLLGRSFELGSEAKQDSDQLVGESYGMAPKVLTWRFVDENGLPLAHRKIGTIELVMIRMSNGQIDDSLRLVYPNLTTNAEGRVWLPVYDTVYSLGEVSWTEGMDVSHELTRWFESPGKVGAMPDAVVREASSR